MEISAPSGHIFLVDEEDWDILPKRGWYDHPHHTGKFYMKRDYRRKPRVTKQMHAVIMKTPWGCGVDHINGNTLDNRRENLRICTNSQNVCNKGNYKNSISKYKGVCPRKDKWLTQIQRNGIKMYIGLYETEEMAAHQYNLAALDLHGEFARLNEIEWS